MQNKLMYVINADWYFELHWLERAQNAVEEGFDVSVVLPSCEDDFSVRMQKKGIKVYKINMSRTGMNPFRELQYFFELKSIIGTVKPDLVHSVTIKPNLYCTIACRLLNVNLISTYAGLGTLMTKNNLKTVFARFLTFSIIRIFSKGACNHALFENQEDNDFFIKNKIIPRSRTMRVFGAGVNLELYKFVQKNKPQSEFKVLFASRLLKDKGLDDLKEAVNSLYQKGVPVKLQIAGIFDFDSPLAYSEQEISELATFPYVDWLGKRSDIPALIAESDVVALPTTYGEGVPRVLIEAASVGKPIITTALGGCKDICIDMYNGLLVKPYCPEDIECQLRKIYDDFSFSRTLGYNGRKLVEKQFSNETILSQHIKLYQSMLRG